MELQSISQISKLFNISTRTLRYYEQIGLIKAIKKDDFAYRTYDENTVMRLQQIITLRKLRIPLKQISDILNSEDVAVAINVLRQNLIEIEDEITALSSIRRVVQAFLEGLHLQSDTFQIDALQLLDDESLLEIVDSLTASKINFKEVKIVDDYNAFSVAFEIAYTDEDRRQAFELYQKAFGAKKISEFTPYDLGSGYLHIIMEIKGFEILLHPCEEKRAIGVVNCQLRFDNEDDVYKAYNVLIQEGRDYSIDSVPHAPLSALVTDKYGVGWWIHT